MPSGKKLSGQCFNLEHERKKALYEGYFSADGYAGKNGAMQTTTISAELAAGIAQNSEGCIPPPRFHIEKEPGTHLRNRWQASQWASVILCDCQPE